jgi:hypothetical protein
VNGKGKDIRNEIYSWLLAYQACLGRCGLATIFANVEMLHNNIFRAIEEMESRVDIEDKID